MSRCETHTEIGSHEAASPPATGFVQGLGLFDCVMIVAGAMIGSGIFIVPRA
jgi:hypothetical protein